MSKSPYSKNEVVVIDQDLVKSPAWMSLRGSATQVYLIFLCKRRMEKLGRKSPKPICTNNGDIVFTYQEAKEKYGISKDSFTRGIDALIDRGLLDIAREGGILKTASKYSLAERWRKYGNSDFEAHERLKIWRGFCRIPVRPTKPTRENTPNITRENTRNDEIITRENARNRKSRATKGKAECPESSDT
jgi:hypothetical protein